MNGTEEGTNFTSSAAIVDSYTAIGATSNSLDFDMDGHIDEMRVSNVARYTENFTAPTAPFVNDSNTVLLLHMDGTDASTLFLDDNGAQGRGNAVSVTANGNAQIDTAQSKFGSASALFDGSQDYLKSIGDFDTTTDWTVEMWVYLPAGGVPSGDYPTLINYADQNTNKGWAFTSNPDERLSFISSYDGSSGMVVIAQTGTGVITAETWHHIAFVKEGTGGKIYVDGVLKATNTSNVIPVPGDSDTHLHIVPTSKLDENAKKYFAA